MTQNNKAKAKEILNIIRSKFVDLCGKGHLDKVKNFISSYSSKIIDIDVLNNGLEMACSNNQLDIVKFLLNSKEIPINADINFSEFGIGCVALSSACKNNCLPIVKYLLTSDELKVKANLSLNGNDAIIDACEKGHIEIVKYLLTSFSSNFDMYKVFTSASYYDKRDIVNFLIFDLKIEQSESITYYLNEFKRDDIKELFQKRELHEKLTSEIKSENINKPRIKI